MGSYLGAALAQQAYRDWRAGKVVPWRLTMALDARDLYGPEVDRACGVEEPAVDMWEAGTLYPTWEQLCALAELCHVRPWAFTSDVVRDEGPVWTTLQFHVKNWEPPNKVWSYPPEVVAATLRGDEPWLIGQLALPLALPEGR